MLTADDWQETRFTLMPHAYRSVRSSWEDAEDAVQDAFEGYFAQVKRGRLIRRPFTYLYKAAINRSMSRARRAEVPLFPYAPTDDPIEQVGESIDRTIQLASMRHRRGYSWLLHYYRREGTASGRERVRAHRLVKELRSA